MNKIYDPTEFLSENENYDDFRILTFSPRDPKYHKEVESVQSALLLWISTDRHKRSSNYTDQNFSLSEQSAISIIYLRDVIYGFAGIYRRDTWPMGYFRYLNRYYVRPDSRGHFKTHGAWPYVLHEQLKFATHFSIEQGFISLHQPLFRRAQSMVKIYSELFYPTFELLKDRYNVCGGIDIRSCWQIILIDRRSDSLPFLLPRKGCLKKSKLLGM